ncbi:hypothetical protein BKA69DRAFT_774326 [Paraphysoderma sedebokerense]|nr:hypothetical protein BKA69DRAFT_774326 [Paraphysoderma sedebokerense]
MASSLAQQLSNLRNPELSTFSNPKLTPSYLFDPREAAKYDLATIHSIAVNGLSELILLDERFAAFEATLFSENSKEWDRAFEGKEMNEKIDKSLKSFLRVLGPWVLVKPAGKVLEWLVRRFRINEFNVDAVMACFLPYHETKQFMTMLRILKLDSHPLFGFLQPLQKDSDASLTKQSLLKAVLSTPALLQFICTSTQHAVYQNCQYKTLLSFYVATVTTYLGSVSTITDTTVNMLLPFIVDGVKVKNIPDYQLANIMILCVLASKATIRTESLETLVNIICQNASQQVEREVFTGLIVVCQSQSQTWPDLFPDKALKFLIKFNNLVGLFEKHSNSDLSSFLDSVLMQLFRHCETQQSHDRYSQILVNLMTSPKIKIPSSTVTKILENVLDSYANSSEPTAQLSNTSELPFQVTVLNKLQNQYTNELEAIVSSKLSNSKSADIRSRLTNLLSASLSSIRLTPLSSGSTTTTLFLGLKHPNSGVRVNAVKELETQIQKVPETERQTEEWLNLQTNLIDLVQIDSSENVVKSVLSSDILIQFVLSDTETAQSFVKVLLVLVGSSNVSVAVKKLAADVLFYVTEQQKVVDNFPIEIMNSFVSIVISHMLILDQSTTEMNLAILNMLLEKSSRQKWLKNYVSGFEKLKALITAVSEKKEAVATEIAKLNEAVIGLLADNLADLKSDDMIKMYVSMIKSDNIFEMIVGALVVMKSLELSATDKYPLVSSLLSAIAFPKLNGDTKIASSSFNLLVLISSASTNINKSTRQIQTQILASLFDAIISFTPKPKKTAQIPWFFSAHGKSQQESANDVASYVNIMKKVYVQLVNVTDLSTVQSFLKTFVEIHFGDNGKEFIKFLCVFWSLSEANAFSSMVQARSISLLTTFLQSSFINSAEPMDFQLLLPTLICTLSSPSKMVRSAGINALSVILSIYSHSQTLNANEKAGKKNKKSKNTMSIFAFEEFYATGTDQTGVVQYLETKMAKELVKSVVDVKQEILVDSGFAKRFLGSHLTKSENETKNMSSYKSAVLTFILTNAQASAHNTVQLTILTSLELVSSSLKIKILTPLLDSAAKQILSNNDDVSENDVELLKMLIDCVDDSVGSVLNKTDDGWNVLLNLVKTPEITYSVQSQTISRLSPSLFSKLSRERQLQLLSALIDVSTTCTVPDVVKVCKRQMNAFTVDAETANTLLENENKQLKLQERVTKRQKGDRQSILPHVYTLTTLLEILSNSKNIVKPVLLISPLFETLHAIMQIDFHKLPVSMEYITQILLSLITDIISGVFTDGKSSDINESILRVELLVQCMRSTDNPQTHNAALLLLSTIASVYPEKVLYNIMPIFTFMGTSILRQDDSYTFKVIERTIQNIIPALVSSQDVTNIEGYLPVVRVFVDAFHHIPVHRRSRLFTVLVQTLGTDTFLNPIVSMLIEKEVKNLKNTDLLREHDGGNSEIFEFCLDLMSEFESKDQFKALIEMTELVTRLPHVVPEKIDNTMEGTDDVISLSDHTTKSLRGLKIGVITFINSQLVFGKFLNKIATEVAANNIAEIEFEKQILVMVEKGLSLVNSLTICLQDKDGKTKGFVQYVKALLRSTYELLDKVHSLLSLPTFIRVMSKLWSHENPLIRRKSLQLFHQKLVSLSPAQLSKHETPLLETIPVLAEIMKAQSVDDETAINKQNVLLCFTSLVNGFGSTNPETFASIVPDIIGAGGVESKNIQVSASSMICLNYFVKALGARMVPFVPKFMPNLLKLIECTLEETINVGKQVIQLGVLSTLEVIIECLPQFMSPYLPRILSSMFHTSLYVPPSYTAKQTSHDRIQTRERINQLITKLATFIQPRLLLPPIFQHYAKIIKQGKQSLIPYFTLVQETVKNMSRENIVLFNRQLFKFFLVSFDYRRLCSKGDEISADVEEIDEVEKSLLDAFVEMVFKLNENLFKPLFMKTVDWATVELTTREDTSSTDVTCRLSVFYRLVDSLLANLKSIFTPYYGFVLDNCVAVLNQFKSGERDPHGENSRLWEHIIGSLHKCLLYDSDGFLTAERFDQLAAPLVSQLSIVTGSSANYMQRTMQYLIPCLGQLAVTAGNDGYWKPLNHQVLMLTRESEPEVRKMALLTVKEFYSRLGEELLGLLPETIPFLAECMEDDDIQVEKTTQELIAHIEQYLGESLQKYFE